MEFPWINVLKAALLFCFYLLSNVYYNITGGYNHITVSRNVLIIGTAGAGKSSLTNNLINEYGTNDMVLVNKHYDIKVKTSTLPVTRRVEMSKSLVHYSSGRNKYHVNIVIHDTPGYGTTDSSEYIEDLVMTTAHDTSFDFVILMLKAERHNPEAYEGLKNLIKGIKGIKNSCLTEENIIVYLTHADYYTTEIQNDLVQEIKNTFSGSGIKVEPIIGSFAKLEDLAFVFRDRYQTLLEASVNDFIKRILLEVTKFDAVRCLETKGRQDVKKGSKTKSEL